MIADLPSPKAVLFDLGNTVLREERLDRKAGAARVLELADDSPHKPNPQDVQQLADRLYLDARRQHDTGVTEIRFQSLLRLLCDRFGVTHDLSPSDIELEYWKAICSMVAEPGVETVLFDLKRQHIAAAVVSNSMFSGHVLEWELKRNQLLEFFDFVISSADYGIQKPHPAIFETAVAKLGLLAEEVWFVGDNIEKDVKGALEAGLTPVWYNRSNLQTDNQSLPTQVRSWPEFGDLIESIVGR